MFSICVMYFYIILYLQSVFTYFYVLLSSPGEEGFHVYVLQ